MSVNLNRTPNHVKVGQNPSVHFYFGELLSMTPHDLGEGHHRYLQARFATDEGTVLMEFCPATASALARSITESIVALPFQADDVHDAVGEQ